MKRYLCSFLMFLSFIIFSEIDSKVKDDSTLQKSDINKNSSSRKEEVKFIGDFSFKIPTSFNLGLYYKKHFENDVNLGFSTGFEYEMTLRFLKNKNIAFWFSLGYLSDLYYPYAHHYILHNLSFGAGASLFVKDFFFGFGFYSKLTLGHSLQKENAYLKDSNLNIFKPGAILKLGYFIPLIKDKLYLPIYSTTNFLTYKNKLFFTEFVFSFGISIRYKKLSS